jgi:hypothetical protein
MSDTEETKSTHELTGEEEMNQGMEVGSQGQGEYQGESDEYPEHYEVDEEDKESEGGESGTGGLVVAAEGHEEDDDLTDDQFSELWNGLDQMVGTGEGWTKAVKWFNAQQHKRQHRIASSCVLFFDKPVSLLVVGKTKNTGKTVAAVDRQVAQYLPKVSYVPQGTDKRIGWGPFRDVNLSMTYRVALIILETGFTGNKQVAEWHQKFGGTPLRSDPYSRGMMGMSLHSRSVEIHNRWIVDMKSYEGLWKNKIVFK